MTVNEAYDIVKKKIPGTKAIECVEFEESYAFFLAPLDYDEKIHGGIGGAFTTVNKDDGTIASFNPADDFDKLKKASKIDILE